MLAKNNILGSPLEAEVEIRANTQTQTQLQKLGEELRFVFITSAASVTAHDESEPEIKVKASTYDKCERCWHRREDVNTQDNYPNICGRCIENIDGKGEARQYA